MSELLRQVLIAVAFGGGLLRCGYLTGFIVTRNRWRDEMIERGIARYNWQTGKWEWGDRRNRDIECPLAASRRLGLSGNWTSALSVTDSTRLGTYCSNCNVTLTARDRLKPSKNPNSQEGTITT